MKTRISLLMTVILCGQMLSAQVHISVSDPLTWSVQELAPYVGQTVIFDVPMYVCSNDNGYTVSTRRLYTPTNQALPRSQEYTTMVSLNSSGRLDITGIGTYHRCGEKIYNLKAKVGSSPNQITFLDGDWKGNTRAELEAGIPDVGDYELLVCAYNLENYKANVTSKRTKIINALKLINADIYGLVEIDGAEEARDEIVNYLNYFLSESQDRLYKVCKESKGQSESQTVAFIYDSKRVKPLGSIQYNDKRTSNRKKMICFEDLKNKERFIYSVNHFKAKSGTGTGGNADMGDGQGSFNADRKEEAQSVVDAYKVWSRQIDEYDLLVMGDLNALGKEDPITVLKDNGLIDLHRAFHADSSYSYQYNKLAGYLDHALCNTTMRPQITGMAAFHINSDESRNIGSSDLSMFRGSDHDPVLVGLKLNGSLNYDPSPKLNSIDILYGDGNTLIIRDAFKDDQKSFYAIYSINGWLVDKQPIQAEIQEVELPQTPGAYVVYIYFDGQVYVRRLIVR